MKQAGDSAAPASVSHIESNRAMTTDRPRVSIVLARHHGTEYLAEALRSCLAQTMSDLEVVLVVPDVPEAGVHDAGGVTDPRVRTVRTSAGLPLADLWNAGAAQTRGQYLMAMTDTERLQPDALERMLALMPASGGVECVYTAFRVNDLSTGTIESITLTADTDETFLGRVSPCYLFTRSAWQRVGGWDAHCEPAIILDHWIRMFRSCGVRQCHAELCESVVWPWRTKNPDWIDLGLMEAAVRYRHHVGQLSELRPWLRRYIGGIWKEPQDWRLLTRWFAPTGRRLRSMSWRLGAYWAVASAGIIVRRMRGHAIDEECATEVQPRWSGRVRFGRTSRPGRQVLCLAPRVVMGGSEKVLFDIVTGLEPRGFRFHLLAEHGNHDRWCRRFRRAFDNVAEVDLPGGDVPEEDCVAAYAALVGRLVNELNIDAILLSNAFPAYAALPAIRAALPDMPIIDLLHVEGYAGMSTEFIDRAPLIDRRVCINGHLQRILIEQYATAGIDAALGQRIDVILNGHDLNRFDPVTCPAGRFRARLGIPERSPIVACIARMDADKRPRAFVDIAARIAGENPDLAVHFVMAGDGPERPRVERQIEAHGLTRQFHLTGVLDYDRVPELLADVDLLLIVSEMEGLPLVMVEAMSMNVPVIATDVGGIRDVIEHGVTGLLVHPDADLRSEFTGHVTRLLRDRSFHDAMAVRTRAVVSERFQMATMHERYASLFARVARVGTGAGGPGTEG